MIRSAQNC